MKNSGDCRECADCLLKQVEAVDKLINALATNVTFSLIMAAMELSVVVKATFPGCLNKIKETTGVVPPVASLLLLKVEILDHVLLSAPHVQEAVLLAAQCGENPTEEQKEQVAKLLSGSKVAN